MIISNHFTDDLTSDDYWMICLKFEWFIFVDARRGRKRGEVPQRKIVGEMKAARALVDVFLNFSNKISRIKNTGSRNVE